jgi:arabinogalactan oligomer / maltooligosaccharide transport system substrate-binding protein
VAGPITRQVSRRSLVRAGVVLGASALIGHGRGVDALAAGAPGYPPYNPALKGEKAKLACWLLPELASHPAYKQAIALFQRQYPGLSVSVTPIAKDDILTKLKIALAGDGAIPDLVSHHGYVLGAQGLAYESDALWSAWGAESTFLPSALHDVEWRLDKFGIPAVSNAVLTILHADMFAKAGVAIPTANTTFAEFTNTVTKVRKANGTKYGTILSADPATVTALIHANGGVLFNTVQGRNVAALADRRVVDAVRFYTELGWKWKLAPLPGGGPVNKAYLAQLFSARIAPAFFGTIADVALIQASGGASLAVAPLPGGSTGKTTGSVSDGASLVVVGGTRKPHAAFELAKWLIAEPPALGVARTLRLAPTVASYFKDPLFHGDRLADTYFSVAQTATPIGLDAYTAAFDLYRDALRSAFGGSDAERALSGIQTKCQTAMDKADAGVDADQ